MSSVEKKIRGAVIKAHRLYVDEGLDAERRRVVMQHLPKQLDDELQRIKPGEYYPIELWSSLSRAVVAGLDPDEAYQTMMRCGRFIGEDAVNTFLRLLIKLLQPSMFARKFPDFFRKDHTFGNLDTDLSRLKQGFFAVSIGEVEGYDYIGATAQGWIGHTLEMIGCKDIKTSEVLCSPPKPQNTGPYRIEFSWS